MAIGACGGTLANPTYMDDYDYWYEEWTNYNASGLCGPELWCSEVDSVSDCSDVDYCYLEGSVTANGASLCCYADMGKSSKSCFDVYGYENAEVLIYDESSEKILGGTMYSDATVGDVDWGYWVLQGDGLRRWYTYDFTIDSCEIDKNNSTFHSYACQEGYWTDEDISEGDNLCYKCPSSNVKTCNQNTVQCKYSYYVEYGDSDNLLCTACPEIDMDSTSGCGDRGNSTGGWGITNCYADTDSDYCDKTGDFIFNSDCKYTR